MSDSASFWLISQKLRWISRIVSSLQTEIGLNRERIARAPGQTRICPSCSKHGALRTGRNETQAGFFSAWFSSAPLSSAQVPVSIWRMQILWESDYIKEIKWVCGQNKYQEPIELLIPCSPSTMRQRQEGCGVMENLGCYVKIFCLEQPQKKEKSK